MGEFTLDHKGIEDVLKNLTAKPINDIAKRIGVHAGPEAVIDEYETDRAAASVSVPAGLQAKHGALTRAAAAAGLEVHLKP
ncbi:hypothetical protein BST43_15125 [Mycobacteroides saopaulense]|uniref:Uncharacterized protein n=1 Tax=Mycobacteroides saopaulense TaxID=1578165 RepID=A0A1X0J0W7_9MYCO|nr:hypothetical protein [Mycobacteroides saopaulense]ORB55203.1 hypothetical protein BST43_15125 [Mycobacteroides saopaulense]